MTENMPTKETCSACGTPLGRMHRLVSVPSVFSRSVSVRRSEKRSPFKRLPRQLRRSPLIASLNFQRITIWDVASHQEVATLEGHQEEVTNLGFTPDGNYPVSASKDQLPVWRAATWAEIEAAEKQARK